MTARHVRLTGLGILGMAVAMFLFVAAVLVYYSATLPSIDQLEDPDYALPTTIYDRNGIKIQEIYIKRRKLVTYDQLPPHLINALIAKEDSRFFEHFGIDPLRIVKAAWVNLLKLDTAQGASTLTQQTARQFFLTLEKTWSRKIREILLALKIEREFTKKEIITLYLNKVNFGDAWGVAAAAEVYFGKQVENLSLGESATLVGLLPAPNRYKPTRNPHLARQQRSIVLQRMVDEGFLTRDEQMLAASEPIVLTHGGDRTLEAAAYYVELVRRRLQEQYGTKNLYEGGLHVYTAMDLSYQVAAHAALVHGVTELDHRRGFRPAEERIELTEDGQVPEEVLADLNPPMAAETNLPLRAVVLEVTPEQVRFALGEGMEGYVTWQEFSADWPNWLSPEQPGTPLALTSFSEVFQPGDLVQATLAAEDPETGRFRLALQQHPEANGGVYSMDPRTGEVLAMVGGIEFGKGGNASEFIRATQAERQPGSSFKPLIYAAAIDEGYTPATMLDDSPRVFTLDSGRKHNPGNYDNQYLGPISLRESLMRSRNVPTVQLVEEMGTRRVIDYARRFGITTAIPEETLIALGTHSVRLSELTRAYAVFPGQGQRVEPIYIKRIEDNDGNVIFAAEPTVEQVISPATAYLITDILQDVVRNPFGTGHKAMEGFDRPAAGKTGTTQNYTDAWYLGFIPQLVTGVYIGFDDSRISLGPSEAGSRAAAPIWKEYMQAVENTLPVETFAQPPTVVAHRVSDNGTLLSACDRSAGSRFELFKVSSIPTRLLSESGCSQGNGVVVGGTRAIPTQVSNHTAEDDEL